MNGTKTRLRYLSDVVSLKLDIDRCTGCRRCVEVCPRSVLRMENKKAAIVDRDLCIECGACAANCESGALIVHEGVGCAAAIINGMLSGDEPTCGCSESDPVSNPSNGKSCC
jgi:NAD-dependent dihydropyrimidine dehydrogenase PreA subunit